MSEPISVDVPHSLGAEEARKRIEGGMGRLTSFIPGASQVRSSWTGDSLALQVTAMGQEVNTRIDVHDAFVRVQVVLPPGLGFVAPMVKAALAKTGRSLLEDKSG